jgi:secondary thiamine-phosphate synthase enzyme
MVIFKDKIYLYSSKRVEILDITLEVERLINKSKIANGIINIYSKHSTSAIVVNENEQGLLYDFEKILTDIVPENNKYKHDIIDNNADSHLRSLFLGPSETIPFLDKKLSLGTWQSIFFIELDGPRTKRTVEVTVIGK